MSLRYHGGLLSILLPFPLGCSGTLGRAYWGLRDKPVSRKNVWRITLVSYLSCWFKKTSDEINLGKEEFVHSPVGYSPSWWEKHRGRVGGMGPIHLQS